jgi:hypothetical protein
MVSLLFSCKGNYLARGSDRAAGKGRWKKRKPFCNGADRGCNITLPEREQTSIWCLRMRELVKESKGGKDVDSRDRSQYPATY